MSRAAAFTYLQALAGTVPLRDQRSANVPRERRKIVFTREELVLAVRSHDPLLIRACLENNIPIPLRAGKFLAMIDGDLAMVMDLVDEDLVGPVPRQPCPQATRRLPVRRPAA